MTTAAITSEVDGAQVVALDEKIGPWVQMRFDREVRVDGIRWLRASGGFGTRGDREDWIADLRYSVHIGRYRNEQWKAGGPPRYDTPLVAMRAAVAHAIVGAEYRLREMREDAARMTRALELLLAADRTAGER